MSVSRPRPFRQHEIFLCSLVFVWLTQDLCAAAARRGSTSRRPDVTKRNRFAWTATLDRSTGLASSTEITTAEVTLAPTSSNPSRIVHPAIAQNSFNNNKHMQSLFESYPYWLARPQVTFGLLRVRKTPTNDSNRKRSKRRDNGSNFNLSLQDVIFGRPLLIFGPPQLQRSKNKRLRFPFVRKEQTRTQSNEPLLTVTWPVVGGLLACSHDDTITSNDNNDLGRLLFSFMQTAPSPPYRNDSTRSPRKGTRSTLRYVFMRTQVVEYLPSISGIAPVSCVRKWAYRSTQSYVHAYVMWRFHRHCSMSSLEA